jgi:hypothetical protein
MLSMQYKKAGIILLLLIFFISTCDHGLSPPPEEAGKPSGICGTIRYLNWPPADSLFDLRLIIFPDYPPENIISEIASGNAVVYPPISDTTHLPFLKDTTSYSVKLSPGIYEYIVIAQQHSMPKFVQENWRVVGQYDTSLSDPEPTAVTVMEDSIMHSIDINVDFENIPLQPF